MARRKTGRVNHTEAMNSRHQRNDASSSSRVSAFDMTALTQDTNR
eukprot:CAMPEP_0175883638 /NCGR_PEP_ID=MMETSP0107_2-20121207/44086_1 /TAXON_ID=195067 ORGANISM="Goniomonas pacifica, Strain CCMP1869" /NCGR_SAMPLE_ID=MMETSP0107_2 /ASSEMBLY_ACC=CAM_ASM_000203 /LENGTH=44 /DNA_ID= /DNA_START= /DNA_END= /DNA_ORIENTATION=